jgi:hypothetical protein
VPALFAFVIFEIGSCFIPGLGWIAILLFVPPHIAGTTGLHHDIQPCVS